jgi:hypothetical protein
MDLPTYPTIPLGPMTRARAKAIETKVNSMLSELPLSTYETWLLSQAETLCVIRYMEESHGAATPNGEDGEDIKYKDQEEELPGSYSHRTTGTSRTSDAWGDQPARQVPASECYSGRTTDADRTTDTSQRPNDQATPDDRYHRSREKTTEVRDQPDDQRTGHPTSTGNLTDAHHSQNDTYRASGPPRNTGRPVTVGRPTPVCA